MAVESENIQIIKLLLQNKYIDVNVQDGIYKLGFNNVLISF